MSETLRELDNRIALLSAARDSKGVRIADYNMQYRRDLFALRTQAEEMRAAEAKTVTLSPDQLAQLSWLDRVSGARDADGKQLFFDHAPRGSALRNSISAARQKIEAGATLTGEESEAIRTLAQSSGAHSYPERVHSGQPGLLPPARFNPSAHLGSQPIITEQNK